MLSKRLRELIEIAKRDDGLAGAQAKEFFSEIARQQMMMAKSHSAKCAAEDKDVAVPAKLRNK